MILIDAIYTHQTGGKVLLDYLVSELEKTDVNVFYLFDDRISKNAYQIKKTNKILFEKSSFFKRFNFYRKNRSTFTKIFCFGNVPPPIKLEATVYTFFHHRIYLEIPKELPFKTTCGYIAKTMIIKFLKRNTDYWIVQNSNIKVKLHEKYNIKDSQIMNLPFYPPISGNKSSERNNFGYIYVSHPFLHKNHLRLIDAFCEFYDAEKKGELILTVDQSFQELYKYIEDKIASNYPIRNIGFIKRSELYKYYTANRYLIFPSLSESFGLGIIEALDCGCDIIGADLPYLYEVCEPSVIFDPNSTQAIKDALVKSIDFQSVKKSIPKVSDKIKTVIELLTK
ncbi:glycosyltransferase [Chryseobacterium sp. Chry.R1]|uniref:glycosyltransferase n=1 Tax=Chryseobacterium sp. Chry.R1 TaxID=3139392 RepID=UPI0031F81ABF